MHPSFHPLFVDFCKYFNGNQDYFECHEVLEEYWKELAPGEKQHILVGFVQLATGMYHWRRGNFHGAHRILKKSLTILRDHASSTFLDVLDQVDLFAKIQTCIQRTHERMPFEAFQLMIIDAKFHEQLTIAIANLPLSNEEFIVHKHKLRDRSDLIKARQAKLSRKQIK